MKVLASYLLSISSSRAILSNVHRKGLSFSSGFFRNSSTSNDVSTNTHFIESSKVYNCESTWAIQNFRLLHGNNLTSDETFSPKDIKYEWVLQLYNGKGNSWHGSSLDLALKPSDKAISEFGSASGEIEFALIDADGEKSCVKKKPFIVRTTACEVRFDKFIKQNDLFDACDTSSLLPGGTLTIYCQVSFVLSKEIKTTVENDFSRDFNNEESSDSTINLLPKDDPKNICEKEIVNNDDVNNLSTKTAVETGIPPEKHNLQESETEAGSYDDSKGVIPAKYLDDVDYDEHDYEEILRYIYTRKGRDLKPHKYEIERLKKMCEVEIADMLSNETAVEILVFSKNHNLENLKEKSIEYITKNFEKVVEANRSNGLTSHCLMKYLQREVLYDFCHLYNCIRGNY